MHELILGHAEHNPRPTRRSGRTWDDRVNLGGAKAGRGGPCFQGRPLQFVRNIMDGEAVPHHFKALESNLLLHAPSKGKNISSYVLSPRLKATPQSVHKKHKNESRVMYHRQNTFLSECIELVAPSHISGFGLR